MYIADIIIIINDKNTNYKIFTYSYFLTPISQRMPRLVLMTTRLSMLSVLSLDLLGVTILPATLKTHSDLLLATGTAKTTLTR